MTAALAPATIDLDDLGAPDLLLCPDCAGEDTDYLPDAGPTAATCPCGWTGPVADLVPAWDVDELAG